MNCHTVRALCELFGRDAGQLDADEQAALDRHLDGCPACREWRQTDRQVDAALASAMKKVSTPVGLERRIRDRLSLARPPRPWGWIAIGVSAALAIGIAAAIWMIQPQQVDLTAVLSRIDEPIPAPREAVEQHLADLGHRVQGPDDLKYDYLRSFDVVSFQNRRVPRLTFFDSQGNRLNVYILSTSAFRLPPEKDGVDIASQSWHVLARSAGEFIYIYEWAGNALGELKK